jgi:branched-chain amino acid transport system permease protein
MSEFLQQLVNGLSLGSTYALLALGLAMVFSIMGLINFAHGELITIGGYVMWTTLRHGIPWEAVVPLVLIATTLAAVAMERIAFRPLRGASLVALLITSFALSYLIQTAFQIFIPTSTASFGDKLPSWVDATVHLGSTTIPVVRLVTAGVTLAALVFVTAFLRTTTLGVSMRAAAEDFATARLMGIRANLVIVAAFALSGLLAGVAAVLFFAEHSSVESVTGVPLVINAFIAVILGGLGNLIGAVVGGYALGLATIFFQGYLPANIAGYSEALALGVVIALLLVRPQGLVGRTAGLT